MKHCLLLLAAALPLSAVAQGFGPLRYDYVSGNLVWPEQGDIGVEVEGSTAVTPSLVVSGSYRVLKFSGNHDRKTLRIGVGHRFGIRPNVDVLTSLGYADNDIEGPGRAADEEGLILGGHVRGWLTARIELNGSVLLDNSTGSSTDTVLEFGGQYFRGANWSYGGQLRKDEFDTVLFLGVRSYFGASRRAAPPR